MSKRDAARTAQDSRGQSAIIGRYALHQAIARGGMATIHLARLVGDEGFYDIWWVSPQLPLPASDSLLQRVPWSRR